MHGFVNNINIDVMLSVVYFRTWSVPRVCSIRWIGVCLEALCRRLTEVTSRHFPRDTVENKIPVAPAEIRAEKKTTLSCNRRGGACICENMRFPHKTIGSQVAVRLSAFRAARPLPAGRFLVLISVEGWVDRRAITWLEEWGKLKKNLVTLLGIENVTCRLVA
jgi:hypothetical protein